MSTIKKKQVIVTYIKTVTMMVIVMGNCTFMKRSRWPKYIYKVDQTY